MARDELRNRGRLSVRLASGFVVACALPAWAAAQPAGSCLSAQTTLAGIVRTTKDHPLPNVVVSDGAASAKTDSSGHFQLSGLPAGDSVLVIDGRKAGSSGNQDYGYYEARITATACQANTLPFTSYLPRIDHAHDVTIPSPTIAPVVVSTPLIPDLELHIPAGMVITDPDGKPVTKVGITPIPIDRTPFPLPNNIYVPIYFTAQPGSSTITAAGGGYGYAQVYYPNYRHELPGARGTFWRYDADALGWTTYGLGSVNAAATQVTPDASTRIYELTGAMFNGAGGQPTSTGPLPPPGKGRRPGFPSNNNSPHKPGDPGNTPKGGEPVDLGTGLFVLAQTDLSVSDVIPLEVERTYRQNDTNSRDFGVGSTLSYNLYLWSANQYQQVDLLMPDGGKVHYVRTSPGTGWTDAQFASTTGPSAFFNSHIVWNGTGWDLRLQDGTLYVFGENAPLQYFQDRLGNRVQLTRANGVTGNILKVSSANGKWIAFTYDASNRITQAKDNSGRTVSYTYDTGGRLLTVTNPNSGVTTYTWDTTNNRVSTIKNELNNTILTNTYDANGRVQTQTLADGGVYQFAYTLNGSGAVTETDVTDPRGAVRKVTFASQYWLTDKAAVGTPQEQDFVLTRDPTTNYPLTETDPLSRQTAWTYDTNGNTTSVTALSGTANAVTTSFTYSTQFNQLTSITDGLNHTTTLQRNALGELTAIVDPLNHSTGLTYNSQGQVATVTNAIGKVTQFTYDHGDLVTVTDPLNRTTTNYADAIGRIIRRADPRGDVTSVAYDPTFGVHQVTDPLGAQTTTNYYVTGLQSNFADPRGGTTAYTYDTKERLTVRQDPLLANDNFTSYDLNDNLLTATDRKGQAVSYTYDPLNRISTATYAGGATVTYTWDLGNRLTQIQDSVAGTITRGYDGLDRLTSETTPQGSVTYTYDAANRRTKMSVSGQADVTYAYDNANRLTQVTQSSANAVLAYDDANRRTSLTLPNGTVASYQYDDASELTAIAYSQGSTAVGKLAYSYDSAGRISSRSGSLFQSVLPAAVSSAAYDADNRLTNWTTGGGATNPTYDANGNLLTAGTQTFTWDSRNRLTAVGGTPASFSYDGVGRRISATLSGATTSYLYDGVDIVEELSGGTPSATLLTGLNIDERFTRTVGSTTSTYLTDNLGSTAALSNASGVIQTSYSYDPYGVTSVTGAANSSVFQYTGRENGVSVNLYYNRSRYYNPAWGRFISEDRVGLLAGPNLYQYSEGDPLDRRDLIGTDPNSPQNSCIAVSQGATVQVGLGGQGTFGAVSFQSSAGFAFDSSGNIALYGTFGLGAGAGGGGDAGLTVQISNAPTVADLGGPFGNISGGGGVIGGGTIDGFSGTARNGQPIIGGGVTGGGAAGETSFGGVTSTAVSPAFNLLGRPTC